MFAVSPPGPETTRESSLHRNKFGRRDVDRDTAAGGITISPQSILTLPESRVGLTTGAQRGVIL